MSYFLYHILFCLGATPWCAQWLLLILYSRNTQVSTISAPMPTFYLYQNYTVGLKIITKINNGTHDCIYFIGFYKWYQWYFPSSCYYFAAKMKHAGVLEWLYRHMVNDSTMLVSANSPRVPNASHKVIPELK